MKKLFFLLTSLLIVGFSFSQNSKKGLQKITFGVVFPVAANTSFEGTEKPFTVGFNLLPNICFVTSSTYHNFLYSMGDNALRMINGGKIKEDLGLYIALAKNLSSSGGYAGVGIEKFIPAAPGVTFFLFVEGGRNIVPTNSKNVLKIGFHLNIQSILWKKK